MYNLRQYACGEDRECKRIGLKDGWEIIGAVFWPD
jgi:hypothetical protein